MNTYRIHNEKLEIALEAQDAIIRKCEAEIEDLRMMLRICKSYVVEQLPGLANDIDNALAKEY